MDAAFARDFRLTAVPDDFFDDPYRYYALLRSHDPVHELGPGSVFLTRYEDVAAVYRDPRASSDKKKEFGPKFGNSPLFEHHTTSLVFNDPPLHARVRRLIVGAVNQRAIARMEPSVVALVESLLDRMADKRAVDLIDDFAAEIPVEVIGNLLGVPKAERGPCAAGPSRSCRRSSRRRAPRSSTAGTGRSAISSTTSGRLVVERRSHPLDPESDVLTRLIQGEADGERLTEPELLHNCIFMLNAGHETTTNTIGNGMHSLLVHRGELERLVRDPALMPTAVEEILRFESPLQLNNRVTTATFEIAGRSFPPGTFLTLGVGAANRDPAQFPDPDRLDVGRKPNRHVAFGHGDHACAGMNVARMEARIAFGRLLARFPKIDLAGAPERDRRVRFRGFRHLPVTLG